MERRSLLEVKHLNSFYEEGNGILSAGKRRKQVLQDVSFSLYQGEVLGPVSYTHLVHPAQPSPAQEGLRADRPPGAGRQHPPARHFAAAVRAPGWDQL